MYKYLPILLLMACACNEPEVVQTPQLPSPMDGLVLVDTHTNVLVEDTATSFSTANYTPLYIGPRLDSIKLNYNVYDFPCVLDYLNYPYADSTNIRIYVDTAQYIGSAGSVEFHLPPPPRNSDTHVYGAVSFREPSVYRGDYKSYPVLLQNKSGDTLNIHCCGYIPLRLEAQDIFGEWRFVQGFYSISCGTGSGVSLVYPNNIVISSCPVFKGWYRTKLRLVYGLDYGYGYEQPVYSNTFYGHIDYRQMYQRNDENLLQYRKRRTSFKSEN